MFSHDLSVRVEAAAPLWEVASEWPEAATWTGTAVPAALRAGVPVLRDVRGADDGTYVRPPGHRRAFYVRGHGPGARGVLAVKGSEPFAANFDTFLDELAAGRVLVECRLGSPARDGTLSRAELSGLDKLPILEGKVPGCVTVREALAEAQAAAAVQRAHVARFGEPAHLPFPIFVGRWPAEREAVVHGLLRTRLRGRAWAITERALAEGLAVYVYQYPAVPLRLAHLSVPDARSGAEVAPRLAAIGKHLSPHATVTSWLELTARLLAIGFVPKDPGSVVSGDCLQPQNVCLDGGFADVESLAPSADLDERALRDALRRTVHELALDATRLLFGVATSTVDLRDRLPELFAIVWRELGDRLAGHAPCDARMMAIFGARPDAIAALVRTLELAF